LAVSLVAPHFADDYTLHIMIISCYYLVLAASWNLLAGYTGRFSLAQQTFATIGAYTTGLAVYYEHVPVWVGILLAALLASSVGFLLGVTVLRMQSSYLALTTWAFAATTQILLIGAYELTGGDQGLIVPPLFGQLTDLAPYYYVFLALVVSTLIVYYAVVKSPGGMFMRAIKDDELRAATLGVDTTRWKVLVFVGTSFFSGLAGAFYAHYIVVVSPSMADFSEMAKIIAMVLIGGLGSFIGPIIGAPLIEALSSYLQYYGQWDTVIYGLAMIGFMRAYRDGLVALALRLVGYLRSRGRGHRGLDVRMAVGSVDEPKVPPMKLPR
jgi:branched-chain amino acid transport system permease protein